MDPDVEVDGIPRNQHGAFDNEEKKKWKRPPSSYGSMKSEDEESEEEESEELGEDKEKVAAVLPGLTADGETRLQRFRSESPETLYTMTTLEPPAGAVIIDTRSFDMEYVSDEDEEDLELELIATSPEPPEPLELEDTMETDENGQPGRLHPEQELAHIFKSIQSCLTNLSLEELYHFKMQYRFFDKEIPQMLLLEADLLDLVDRMIEVLGQGPAMEKTISILQLINQSPLADELSELCKRALIRFHLKDMLIRQHETIFEGVPKSGRRSHFDSIYVEPQISTTCYGGIDPTHEFRLHPPTHLPVPSPDTFIGVNNLFRLQKDDGTPVRTVLTTGIAGIGMTVSVFKFCLDWAQLRANKDLQFVIKLSFRSLWLKRDEKISFAELITYFHPFCKNMPYLEEEGCRFLIILDSFDRYRTQLDWQNAPVINDIHTQAHLDVLIVNIIRGTLLRNACLWILGRRAALSQIPTNLIDAFTEIQGFSDEMKDEYLMKRFPNAQLAAKIVDHSGHLPTLRILARQPFVCWLMATLFERLFTLPGYGEKPPRLTPFLLHIIIVQINRRLEFYYGQRGLSRNWSPSDTQMVTQMGHMALKMLEKDTSVFWEDNLKEYNLELEEVTVLSGLCTELPMADSDNKRRFCFIHFTVQEFMAALYVFIMFHSEGKNVLDTGYRSKRLPLRSPCKSKTLVDSAVEQTLRSPVGHYDLFLRYLCGLLSPDCHSLQSGFLFPHNTPKVTGLAEVQQLLEQTIRTAPADRVENMKECLRELAQEES